MKVWVNARAAGGSPVKWNQSHAVHLRWLLFEFLAASNAGHIFSSGPRQSFVLSTATQWCLILFNKPALLSSIQSDSVGQ